jgi:hypothetical protein
MSVSPDALLAEILKRSDFIFAGWNVLMLAGVGVLVAVGVLSRRVGGAVLAAFGFFAVTHLLGMLHVVKQWASLTESLKAKLTAEPKLLEQLDFAVMAPDLTWIVPFHLAFDALVLVLGWRLRSR